MVLKREKIVDVGDDRNYVEFDEASEAAVERWLTSPASSSRVSCMTDSPSNSSTLGGRNSHTGAFNSSDLDSVTRSMSEAAASALIQANEAVSSPGGQFSNKTPQSAPGRNILRERLRQRVLKNEMSGKFDEQYGRMKFEISNPTTETLPHSHSGRTPTSHFSAITSGSSTTPQYRLETLLQDKGLMTRKRNPSTPSTASSATSPSTSDVLNSFVASDLLSATSSLTDGGRSFNPDNIQRSQNRRKVNELPNDFVSRQVSNDSPSRTHTSPPSSPRLRRKSSTSSHASEPISSHSSPRRKSSSVRPHRENSGVNSTHDSSSVRRQENVKRGGDGNTGGVNSPSNQRNDNRHFFGRSSGASQSSRSASSSGVIPLQQEAMPAINDSDVMREVTPSTRQVHDLREVKTFSPKRSANKSLSYPKSVTSSSIVVESRQQSDNGFRRQSQPVRYERRQTFSSPSRTNRIRLHIYDLIASETVVQLPWGCHFPIGQCFNVVNSSLHQLGTGAYHVGVEVNGVEYAYGSNDARDTTGVFTCMPKHSPGYQYRTTIDFGERMLRRKVHIREDGSEMSYRLEGDGSVSSGLRVSEREVDGREVLREMAREYMGTDYDLLRKNCCTFAHDAAVRLGVKEEEVPSWFRNLCQAGAVTQDAAVSTMQPISQVFSACDCDMNEDVPEYVENTGFEVISTEAKPAKNGRGAKSRVQEAESVDEDGYSELSTNEKFRRTISWRY